MLRRRQVKFKLPTQRAGQEIKITLCNWSAYQDFILPTGRETFLTDAQGEAIANLWARAVRQLMRLTNRNDC
jgi:hypothetical protein